MSVPEDQRARFEFRLKRIRRGELAIGEALGNPPTSPSGTSLAAAAWILNSVYTDMEEVWKNLNEALGNRVSKSESWHRDLLAAMRDLRPHGTPAVSGELFVLVEPLLAFRHFSRYATFPDLEWTKMQPLVAALPRCVSIFERDTRAFLRSLEP